MNSRDLASMSLRNLWRRKLRTFLTLLGVMIGATSIVIMLSLGLAIQVQQDAMLERMGSLTTITVTTPATDVSGTTRRLELDERTASSFVAIPGVSAVAKVVSGDATLTHYGSYRTFLSVQGVERNYFRDFDIKILEGRSLGTSNKNRIEIVVPSNVREFLYSSTRAQDATSDQSFDPMYERVYLGNPRDPSQSFPAQVVGIYESETFSADIYVLIEDMEYMNERFGAQRTRRGGQRDYSQLLVKVGEVSDVQSVRDNIAEQGYTTRSLQDFAEQMDQGTIVIQAVLGGIGSISLLVAAIGIANTMVMSIYERTREIGVMKVIGASVSDIRRIFLTEASLIGLLGGVLGVALSLGISSILNFIFQNTPAGQRLGSDAVISVIPIWLIFLALIFSSMIGLMAGYFPAKRATKLSAIEAIKTE